MMGKFCLGFEELEGFVVRDYMDPVFHEFVFPALEQLKYCKCLYFMDCVVLLCQGEFLGHESSRLTSLPCGPCPYITLMVVLDTLHINQMGLFNLGSIGHMIGVF
jgi:hypothetical protein